MRFCVPLLLAAFVMAAAPAYADKIRVANTSRVAVVVEIASTTSAGFVTLQLSPNSGTTFTVPTWWGTGIMVHSPSVSALKCPFTIVRGERYTVLMESTSNVSCP